MSWLPLSDEPYHAYSVQACSLNQQYAYPNHNTPQARRAGGPPLSSAAGIVTGSRVPSTAQKEYAPFNCSNSNTHPQGTPTASGSCFQQQNQVCPDLGPLLIGLLSSKFCSEFWSTCATSESHLH